MVCYLSIIFAKKPNCERKEEHCGHTWKKMKMFFFLLILPEATRHSARVWLKMLTSTLAAKTLRANLILAANMRKPARKARIVKTLPPSMFAI